VGMLRTLGWRLWDKAIPYVGGDHGTSDDSAPHQVSWRRALHRDLPTEAYQREGPKLQLHFNGASVVGRETESPEQHSYSGRRLTVQLRKGTEHA
jgi:hypothetical protein